MAFRLLVLSRLDELSSSGALYEQVILTRSDHYYACAHPPIWAEPGELYVPYSRIHFGISDRHHVFHFASRRLVLGVLSWLVDGTHTRPADYQTPSARRVAKRDQALESVLALHAAAVGLRVRTLDRTMFVVADLHAGDTSRWGVNGFPATLPDQAPGDVGPIELWCKYDDEITLAAVSCKLDTLQCASPVADAWVEEVDSHQVAKTAVAGHGLLIGGGQIRHKSWRLRSGISLAQGEHFQRVLGETNGSTWADALRERYRLLVAAGLLPAAAEAIDAANATGALFKASVCSQAANMPMPSEDGRQCLRHYWALRLMQRLGIERAAVEKIEWLRPRWPALSLLGRDVQLSKCEMEPIDSPGARPCPHRPYQPIVSNTTAALRRHPRRSHSHTRHGRSLR